MESRLLRVADVAAKLKVHPETVRDWLRQGRLRGSRLGGDRAGWRIAESEVERFLQAGTTDPTTTQPAGEN